MKFRQIVILIWLMFAGACSGALAEDPQIVHVKISGFQFAPNTITVKKGGSVMFTNEDSAPHTVAPDKGAHFANSGRMLKGESKTVIFDKKGAQHYFCDLHPSMKGVVNVVD